MTRRNVSVVLISVFMLGIAALVLGRNKFERIRSSSPTISRSKFLTSQDKSKHALPAPRNLTLQPEASRLSRLLGQRFKSDSNEQSDLTGSLKINGEQKTVHLIRTQAVDGEQVRLSVAGTANTLTWDAQEGSQSSASRATGGDRDLIERLVFDSPDQFVLAQLRGASYYTVARNVRTEGASKKDAPLWNIVRVDDPQLDEGKRPLSRWRLYYINVATGLIDRIMSDAGGQRIAADISWTEVQGEKVPAKIVWSSQGRTLMEYQLQTFAHAPAEGAKP